MHLKIGEFNHENDQVEEEEAEQVKVPPEEQHWSKRHKLSLYLRETQQMSLNDSMQSTQTVSEGGHSK